MKTSKIFIWFYVIPLLLAMVGVCRADLVGHWQANGNADDSTTGGHTGMLLNGAGYGAGIDGQAFEFDGVDDFVSIPGDPMLMPTSITVAMWINASPGFGLRLVADSSHGGTGNPGGWALQLNGNDRLSFAYGNGSSFPELASSSIIADDTFHHIAAVLDGSEMRIYVDGLLDSSMAYSGTPMPSTANMGNIHLGNHYQFSRPLDGRLDDVRIYDTALSDTEIAALVVPEPSAMFALIALAGGLVIRRVRSE